MLKQKKLNWTSESKDGTVLALPDAENPEEFNLTQALIDYNVTVKDVNMTIRLKTLFKTYAIFLLSDRSVKQPHSKIARLLTQQRDVLAVEWLKYQNMFGVHAGLDEMNNHKIKCKKQPIEYDHDEEVRRKIEIEKAEAER